MINKRLINTGVAAAAAFDPLQNFEVVTYTGNGGTQKITGYIRKGAAFNGSSSKIVLSQISRSSSMTLSCWVRTTNTDIPAVMLQNGTVFRLGIDSSGKATTSNLAGTNCVGTTTINDGNWHHIVGIFNDGSGNKTLYVDGVLEDTETYSSGSRTYVDGIGVDNVTVTPACSIDQVRIFNKAISSSEVTTLYGETYASSTKSTTDIFGDGSGVALYELDEDANGTGPSESFVSTNQLINLRAVNYTSGSTWTDVSGQGNNATLTNPTKPTTESVHFDYADLGAQNQYGGNNVSIEFFIKTTNTDDDYFLTAYDGGGLIAGEMVLYIPSSVASGKPYLRVSGSTGSSSQLAFNHTVVQNDWTHYVLVYDSSLTGNTNRFIMYVNGSAVTTSVVGGIDSFDNSNFMGDTSTLFIGKRGGGTDYEEMDIKEFRIYSKSLSSSEVAQNYAASAFAYNGTATNVNFLGMAFTPDLVWIKDRGVTNWHTLQDSVRGAGKTIFSNVTNAESGNSNDLISSFDTNGFTVNTNYLGTTTNPSTNGNGNTYVGWCFKGGGTAVSNTNGSITSTVSANQAAGFSIVKYTGIGSTSTIGHGLSSAPEMMIIKNLTDGTRDWAVYHKDIGNTSVLRLDTTDAASANSVFWNNTSPTSTVFTVGNSSITGSSDNFIAYCFHSTDFQKIGSYTGNGTAGTDISVGFQPRFVMIKSATSVEDWLIFDSTRGNSIVLYANLSSAEAAYSTFVFNSTGFTIPQWGSINGSGQTYIYLAIK